jgi:uncharacterized protein YecE (DUF72 family)
LELLPTDIKFAAEFRDQKWITGQSIKDLNDSGVALTLTDSKWVKRETFFAIAEQAAVDFCYVRWLGPRELTDYSRVQIDRSREMAIWAEFFKRHAEQVKIIFGYFNNHFQGHSPASCNEFKRMLGLPSVSPDALIVQPSLF